MEKLHRQPGNFFVAIVQDQLAILRPELAARVSVPALVVSGDAGLPFMPDAARVLSRAIPQGRLRMLAGQTHEVKPGVLAPVLVEFFTS